MLATHLRRVRTTTSDMILAVPGRFKIAGIMILPVLILGFTLNYWAISGLSITKTNTVIRSSGFPIGT